MLAGRRRIFANNPESDEKLMDVLQKVMPLHEANADEIRYLFEYKRGIQPIRNRIKPIRSEINYKVVENHAREIVDFEVGYVFGSPITLVHKNKQNDDEVVDDGNIALLNEMLHEEGRSGKDRRLGECVKTCGVGYRMVIPKREKGKLAPFDLLYLDPERTFVVRSNDVYQKIILGVHYVYDDEGQRIFTVYSDKYRWEIRDKDNELRVASREFHGLGMVPIVEYRNNDDYMGSFEPVIGLLDALNILTSDRLNDISQFVQSLLWLNNCDIDEDEYKELLRLGLIKTKSTQGVQADIKYLAEPLNQSGIQMFADYLYKQILQICGVPGRERSTGGNTGDAVKLSDGWQIAEEKAKNTELLYEESHREELRLIQKICEIKNSDLKFKLSDVDVKFNRNKTANLLVKTQGLMNMLQAGIHPRVAISHCDLFSDPQQVYMDSETGGYLDKWKVPEKVTTDGSEQQVKAEFDGTA